MKNKKEIFFCRQGKIVGLIGKKNLKKLKPEYSRKTVEISIFFSGLIHITNTDILVKKKVPAEAGM